MAHSALVASTASSFPKAAAIVIYPFRKAAKKLWNIRQFVSSFRN